MINRKYLFAFILILSVQFGISQYRFEPGYYISNDGNKIDCFIQKKEWANWSNEFFNASINGIVQQIKIRDVKEFGIGNKLKFITKELQIEKSLEDISQLDKSRNFVFEKERILLKVIVEGDLSLYQYLENNVKKYFIKTNDGNITQLRYKRYTDDINVVIKEVNEYKDQLKAIMKCSSHDFDKLNYELRPLKKYILNQNKCSNSNIKFAAKHVTQPRLLVSGSVGLSISNLNVTRAQSTFDLNSIDPNFGIDFSFLIPTITNDVEINFKTSYNAFRINEDVDFVNPLSSREVNIEYAEVLLGIGGGYRFHIDNDKSISIGGEINYPILLQNTTYTETLSNLDLTTDKATQFVSISAGLHIKKVNFIAEYFFNRNIFEGLNNFEIDLNRITARVSYVLF